jgi:hypothetical protein
MHGSMAQGHGGPAGGLMGGLVGGRVNFLENGPVAERNRLNDPGPVALVVMTKRGR